MALFRRPGRGDAWRRLQMVLCGAGAAVLAAPAAADNPVSPASAPAFPPADAASEVLDQGVRGQLRPVRHTVLAAGIGGQVKAFPAVAGNTVKAGQVLVQMVCDELDATFAMARARVEAAAAQHSVNKQLAAANNISGVEVDLSRAELAVARAEQDRIAAQRAYCVIRAPFDGVVTEKLAEAHQHVTAGTALLELVDNTRLEVEVAVPSVWLSRVTGEASFAITLDETGETVRGSFVRTVGRVDPVSQTLRVIGELTDPPPGLLTGMSGRVRLEP